MNNPQNSQDECEKFLERQKPWVRAILKGEYGSADIPPALAQPGGIETFLRAADEYEDMLKDCPKHLREYRARVVENAKQSAQIRLSHLGPVKRGRTPSREVQEVGRRAAELYNQGYSWGRVANSLCPRKHDPGHKCNKVCADRIRHKARPYLDSSKQMRGN